MYCTEFLWLAGNALAGGLAGSSFEPKYEIKVSRLVLTNNWLLVMARHVVPLYACN
jgi:hypothetical protein